MELVELMLAEEVHDNDDVDADANAKQRKVTRHNINRQYTGKVWLRAQVANAC